MPNIHSQIWNHFSPYHFPNSIKFLSCFNWKIKFNSFRNNSISDSKPFVKGLDDGRREWLQLFGIRGTEVEQNVFQLFIIIIWSMCACSLALFVQFGKCQIAGKLSMKNMNGINLLFLQMVVCLGLHCAGHMHFTYCGKVDLIRTLSFSLAFCRQQLLTPKIN